ncbi:Trichohyalin-plectin-homology domain-containing protein [Plasmodiophora brassicae]
MAPTAVVVTRKQDDENLDDADLSVLKSQLAAARHERKRAESDAQMLSNRLLLLKAEMSKANRKIEETKSRTKFIYKVQQESEKRHETKLLFRGKLLEQSKEVKVKVERRKSMDHVLQVEASKQKVVGKKKEQVLRVKEDRTLHLQQIREQREASRRAAYQRKAEIQQQHEQARLRKEEEARARRAQVKRQVHSRIEREHLEAQQRMVEIERMEKVENEMLAQLKKIQEKQRRAYDSLESALAGTKHGETHRSNSRR